MAVKHGSKARVYVNDRNLSGYLRSAGSTAETDTADVSTLLDENKKFIAGLDSAALTLEGLLDQDEGAIEELLNEKLGEVVVGAYLPQGDGLGNVAYGVKGVLVSDEVGTEMGDAGTVSAEIQSDVGRERGVSLHPLGAESTTGDGTGVDNAASSANGGAGYLIVTANTRNGSTTVNVQHSSDGSVWADLVTFTAVGSGAVPDGERIAVSGTVNRHLRATRTLAGSTGSITYFVGFARR